MKNKVKSYLQKSVVNSDLNDRWEVHILTSSQHLDMCLIMLISLCVAMGVRFEIIIHDDGTLTGGDFEKIHKYVSWAKVIDCQKSNQELLNSIEAFPNCYKFRKDKIFAKKLFDFFFYANRSKFLMLDSDVIFYSFPIEIDEWFNSKDVSVIYNWDPFDYSQTNLKSASVDLDLEYSCGLNIGIFGCDKDIYDIELIELILGYYYKNNCLEWVTEQNCFNLLASRYKCEKLSRKKYFFQNKRNVFYRNRSIDSFSNNIIAKHYSRYARGYFMSEGLEILLSNVD